MGLLAGIQEAIQSMQSQLAAVHAEIRTRPPASTGLRESYSTEEVAAMLGKAEYTVREWCRQGRVNAAKREERRGSAALWCISADELARFKNDGLLPPDPTRNSST